MVTIEIDEAEAWLIMGALSVCRSEGINGLSDDAPGDEHTRPNLIRKIRGAFPEAVKQLLGENP